MKQAPVGLAAAILITLVALSFFWNRANLNDQVVFLATNEAQSNWNKDLAFRRWATKHGGIYVRVDERTPPSPYMAHVNDRDVSTTDGLELTLMNPAYMMRQMTHEFEEAYGVKGKITGRVLLNPNNKADSWELAAMDEFDQGAEQVTAVLNMDGHDYLRLMRPLYMTEGCVKCHGYLGFEAGDLRGGVSVSVPLDKYREASAGSLAAINGSHALVLLVGLVSIGLLGRYAARTEIAKKRVEKAAQQTRQMDALGDLSGGIAHDFNNILAVILGNLELIKLDHDPADLTYQRAEDVCDTVERAVTMTRRLMSFSKNRMASKAVINVNEVITRLEHILHKSLMSKAQLRLELSQDHCTSNIDQSEFERALLNLVVNARHAMAEGGTVTIGTRRMVIDREDTKLHAGVSPGEYILVTVSDTGCGIPADIMDHIFTPFFSTKSEAEGTGLGLSLVYSFVTDSEGSIHVNSLENEGTTFCVYLPVAREPVEEAAAGGINLAPHSGHSQVVLVVDDELQIANITRRLLEGHGHKVYVAGSAKQAIVALNKHEDVEVLVSDVIMPGMDGFALADYAQVHFPKLRIVLTTGFRGKTRLEIPPGVSTVPILQKPYTSADLLVAIQPESKTATLV